MKNKKILTALGVTSMALLMSFSAIAGCKREEHAYTWTVNTEATCSGEGKRTGVCGICGDVKEEKIPVDKDAHAYGEWQITQPDTEKDGSAERVCSLNGAHKDTAVLPKITNEGTGYLSSDITKQPSVVEEGERTFVLQREGGNITFVQKLPRKKLQTVSDAVLLGSSRGDMIRTAKGRFTEASTAPTVQYHNFTASFNGDHTVVTESGEGVTQYFSRDDEGKVFGIQIIDGDGVPKVMEGVTDSCLLGYGYSSGSGNGLRIYGAERTLEWYYEKGEDARKINKAVKYAEDVSIGSDGRAIGSFGFSYFENPFFARYKMEFELASDGVIEKLKLTTTIIRQYMIAVDDNGELMFEEDGDVVFGKDDDGNPYSDTHPEVSVRILEYTEQVRKSPDDILPENPYGSKVRYITDFNVSYSGREITEEYCPLFPSLRSVDLSISNVLPATADLDFDPLRIYVRTGVRDIELNMTPESNPYNVVGFFNKEDKKVTLRATYAGKVTLVLKTKGGLAEKVIEVEFDKSAPSTIFAEAYIYSDSDGEAKYGWQQGSSDPANAIKLYVGQSLKVRSNAAANELAYADLSFVAEVTDKTKKDGVTFTEEEFEGRTVSVATPVKAGTYQIWVRYKKEGQGSGNGISFTSFFVEAVEPPRLDTIVNGEYVGTLQDVLIGTSGQSADVKVEFDYVNDYRNAKVHITVGELTADYYYVFDTQTLKFTLTHYDGVSAETNPTFDFSLEINEAYKPVLTHSTTFGGGAEKESIVLSRPKTEQPAE